LAWSASLARRARRRAFLPVRAARLVVRGSRAVGGPLLEKCRPLSRRGGSRRPRLHRCTHSADIFRCTGPPPRWSPDSRSPSVLDESLARYGARTGRRRAAAHDRVCLIVACGIENARPPSRAWSGFCHPGRGRLGGSFFVAHQACRRTLVLFCAASTVWRGSDAVDGPLLESSQGTTHP
jgi:hypothetical protein